MRLLGRPALVLAPIAAMVVGLSLFTNVLPFRQIVAQRHEITATQEHLDHLREANEALEVHVDALHTPLEIERLAREQLGYVRPGEEAFVVIEPEPEPVPSLSQPEPADDPASRPWYLEIWDYLTGRDLTTTG